MIVPPTIIHTTTAIRGTMTGIEAILCICISALMIQYAFVIFNLLDKEYKSKRELTFNLLPFSFVIIFIKKFISCWKELR
ncbi:MAG: hypothetical protein UR84_C0023G0003 [candidate division WS6 bacterium GW2011_GWD1_35_594]|nr:MAG: hypothetical protein UR84_C0023G0003 [candidate division WS6 bacterium GW2011_GWD1_35_594]